MRQPGARDDRADGAAVQALQVADLGRVLALAGAPRRPVGLQRHLHDHRPARARDLRAAARRGRGRARARARGRPARRRRRRPAGAARRRARPSRSRSRARAIATAASVISTPDSAPPKPRRCSSHSSAPSPQPTSSVLRRPTARAPAAQGDHVVGLADARPSARQRAYAAASAGSWRVGGVVEADEAGGVLHSGDYCGRDDSEAHGVAARGAGDGAGAGGAGAVRRVGHQPGGLSGDALGARRADRAGAAGDRAGDRARCALAEMPGAGAGRARRAGRVHGAQLPVDPVGGGARATPGKGPTGRCCTCSCSRCSPAGASRARARRCCCARGRSR